MAEITLLDEQAGRAKWRELASKAPGSGRGPGFLVLADSEGNLFGIPLGLAPSN